MDKLCRCERWLRVTLSFIIFIQTAVISVRGDDDDTFYSQCYKDSQNFTPEQCLYKHLLETYSLRGYVGRLTLPQKREDSDSAFAIFADVMPVRILEVDVGDQSLKLRLDIDVLWHDPFLSWRADGIGDEFDFIRLQSYDVWTPDISSVRSGEVLELVGTSTR